MFSLTQLPDNQDDLGTILVRVQDDLRHLREQINDAVEGRSTEKFDLRDIEKAIERAEQGVKAKTANYVQAVNNQVITLPSLDQNVQKKKPEETNYSPDEKPYARLKKSHGIRTKASINKGLLQPIVVAKSGHKPAPNVPSPGQQNKDLRTLEILTKPEHPATRDILNEKYGVALPHILEKTEGQVQVAIEKQKVVIGCTVEPLTTLPRSNRIDPSKTPPPVTENDAKKGILSLLERGLIPAAAELSLEPSPVHHHQAMLHNPKHQFLKGHVESPKEFVGVGGYNISAVKVDYSNALVAKETSLAEKKKKNNLNDFSQGWTDNSVYQINPHDINAIMPLSAPVPTPSSDVKSQHKFVIQNGVTRSTSQDFVDFKQHYCLSWGSILTLILKLEEIFRNYSIPLAIVDGDRLADLALVFELEEKPNLDHFLTCLLNSEDVEKMIKMPGRRFLGPDGETMAAIKLQSSWRRYKDRTAYLKYRQRHWAAGVIAISWIMNCKLSMIRKQLKHLRQTQTEKFKLRSRIFRAKWSKIKESRRVIVHIPSLGYPQHVRDHLNDLPLFQNLQMARLCDLADPKVEVVYVSPVELTDDVYQYYSKLLAMRPNAENEHVENRYKIIIPEAVHRFPNHNMCLSSILKYSPKSIQRIKSLIKGKDAYIVPGVLHQDDLYVADLLDVPILSAEPDIATLYASKSGSKRIFLSAKVDIPPSEFDIYSLPQLHDCLSQLVCENLHIKRWLFKMDNEFDGRGTAFCDITPHLNCYTVAVKECRRYGDKWSKKWAHEPTLNKICSEIPNILSQHATPVCEEEYTKWERFLEMFLQRGGIIEACPPSDSVTAITVDLAIEPDGNISLLCTSDQIHATSLYQCWGNSVPQTSVDPSLLANKAKAIANACRLREIIGYISIDFVTFIDPGTMDQELWAVDLKLTHSDSLAQMKLMQYVTNGSFDHERSIFQVPIVVSQPEATHTLSRRRKTIKEEQPPPSPHRYAIFSSRLQHSNLSVIHYSVFFQMCRAHGIGFDLKEKAGTIFCLVDSTKREYLTMMVISDDLQGSLSTFARNLSVVHQEISAPNMQGQSNFQAAINDIDTILGTTEENLKQLSNGRTPQLKAPRPKELQKILQEHQNAFHNSKVQDEVNKSLPEEIVDRGVNDGRRDDRSQIMETGSHHLASSSSIQINPPPPTPRQISSGGQVINTERPKSQPQSEK